jgi:hypothetical protein
MPENKLHAAFEAAMEKGYLEKAEAIGQLIGKEPEEHERRKRLEFSKHNNRRQSLRSVEHQQRGTFRPERKRVAVHSSWKGQACLPGAGCTSMVKV